MSLIEILAFAELTLCILLLLYENIRSRQFLKSIIACLESLEGEGTALPLPDIRNTSSDMRRLTQAVADFATHAQSVHSRDMEVSRVKSDFISTAAHQLRTPLTGIRWALEALQKEELTEDQRSLVQNAVDKSHDLVTIVGTLLDISSIESGKYKYSFSAVDLTALASEVTRDFSPLAQEHGVSLFYEGTHEKVPLVRADRERVKWVLNNLIENAVRYTPAGGTVRVSITINANRVQVMVRDTGIGIPQKERGNIFERFYRANNAISKENKGNGLGLYIARAIATDHGGDLTFKANDNGPGTSFVFSLPTV